MSEHSIERAEARQDADQAELGTGESMPESVPTAANRVASGGRALAGLALVVALAAAGAAGWAAWRQEAVLGELKNWNEAEAAMTTRMTALTGELQHQAEVGSNAHHGLDARLDQLETGREGLDAQIQRLESRLQASLDQRPERWRAAEAEYLIRLANLRLHERDRETALRLLADADTRVRDLAGSEALRSALARDTAALRAAPVSDIHGTVLRLESLLPQIAELTTTAPEEPALSAEEQVNEQLRSEWQQRLSAVWKAIKRDWIEVRHYQGAAPELELPDSRLFLDQNLALALQQAEWGATHGDAELYRGALNRAETWVRRYFTVGTPAVDGMLAGLAELKTRNVAPVLPVPEASLTEAHALLERMAGGAGSAPESQAPATEPMPASEDPNVEPKPASAEPEPGTGAEGRS